MSVPLPGRLQIPLYVFRELPQVSIHPRVYLHLLAGDPPAVKLLDPERPPLLVEHPEQERARLLSVDLDRHGDPLEPGGGGKSARQPLTSHLIVLPPSVLLSVVISMVISVIPPVSVSSTVNPLPPVHHEVTVTLT